MVVKALVVKSRREEEVESFKTTVLDTAVELMREEKDWGKVSVNKIASIMRYTPPLIYHYFENKDDIQFHLSVRGSTILGKKLRKIFEKKFDNPRLKLFQMGLQFWDFSNEHEELYDIMFHIRQKKLELDLIHANIKMLEDTIHAINPKINTDEEAYRVYQGFHSLIHGFISIRMNNRIPVTNKVDYKQLFRDTLKKYIDQI